MSNVVPFPFGRRLPAKAIPREEFEQLAELALDVVQRIIILLAEDTREEDEVPPPSLHALRFATEASGSLLSSRSNHKPDGV